MTRKTRRTIGWCGALHTRRSALTSLSMLPLISLVRCKSNDAADTEQDDNDATAPGAALEARYRAKIDRFVEAFNDHDLERAASFFADDASLLLNEEPLQGRDAIRDFLTDYGASKQGGALTGAHMLHEVSYFTGDGMLFEGVFHGTHERDLSGYAATGFDFPIAFAFLCEFDDSDRCLSCDAFMNWGALLPTPG
jgi:ketosteroid isomerase-like protein